MKPETYSIIFFVTSQVSRFSSWAIYELVKRSGKAWPKDLWALRIFVFLMVGTGIIVILKRLKQLRDAKGNFSAISEKIHLDTIEQFSKQTIKQRKINLAFGYGVLALCGFILIFENDEYTPKVAFMAFFGLFVLIYQTYKFVVLKKIVSSLNSSRMN